MRKTLLTLAAVLSCMTAMAQWSNSPDVNNRVTPLDQTVYSTEFGVNKDGITFLHYNGPKNGTTTTFLQIIDQAGNKLLPEEGKVITAERTRTYTMVNDILMIDDDGNALLAVSDCRNSPDNLQYLSYTIYKVSPTGEMLWGEEGLDLEKGHSNDFEAALSMVQRTDGSYVFAWEKDYGDQICIQMECISKDKEFLWEESVYLKEDNVRYTYPYLTDAGNNQIILVYAKGTNQDIMARKIDFDGASVWEEDARIYKGGFPAIPLHVILKVAPDPRGGVFVGWYDDRYFTNYESTYVSYVNPDGKLAFSAVIDGQTVGTTEYIRKFTPDMLYDQKTNCLYVLWRETSAGGQTWQGIKMQKVAMTGELMWDPEGIDIVPLADDKSVGYYTLQSAGDGEVVAFYMLRYGAYGQVGAYATKVNGDDGSFIWQDQTITITSPTAEKANLTTSPLINGDHWITMWKDQRDKKADEETAYDGISYMQCVNIDGTLGVPVAIETINANQTVDLLASTYTNSIQFTVTNGKAGLVDLSIYSLSGQKIASAFNNQLDGGTQTINWNTENISSGVYIATLTTSEGSKSIRILVK